MNSITTDSAVQSLRSLEPKLTKEVRLAAIKAGWPKEVARVLKVTVADDSITVTYPDEYADQIDDLEYGTRTVGPKPVFRLFVRKHTKTMADAMEKWVMAQLAKSGPLS